MKEIIFNEEGYNLYKGRFKDKENKILNWYDDNVIKTLPSTDDFVLKIKIGDEYLIDILKEKNDLEFLKIVQWKK